MLSIDQRLNKNLKKLNPTDFIIYRYILHHRQECEHISIYDIASACHVSRTTVLRFAKKLEFDGFSDLKALLKLENKSSNKAPSSDIAKAAIDLCSRVATDISHQDFKRVNALVYRARHIFIFPSGHVQQNVAHEITRLFLFCNIFIYEIKAVDEFEMIIKNASPDDLFIIVSLSGESPAVVSLARKLHIAELPLISITRLKSNTLASLSTENIYITPVPMPTAVAPDYESVLMFFLIVEIWFVSYTHYSSQQSNK